MEPTTTLLLQSLGLLGAILVVSRQALTNLLRSANTKTFFALAHTLSAGYLNLVVKQRHNTFKSLPRQESSFLTTLCETIKVQRVESKMLHQLFLTCL
jgi:hypothetical protein